MFSKGASSILIWQQVFLHLKKRGLLQVFYKAKSCWWKPCGECEPHLLQCWHVKREACKQVSGVYTLLYTNCWFTKKEREKAHLLSTYNDITKVQLLWTVIVMSRDTCTVARGSFKKKKVHLSKQPRPVSILKLEKLLNKEKQQKKNFLWCLKGLWTTFFYTFNALKCIREIYYCKNFFKRDLVRAEVLRAQCLPFSFPFHVLYFEGEGPC